MGEEEHNSKLKITLLGGTGDMIGRIPSWIIRWGTLLVLFIFAVLILATFIFRYPDVISARITVTTENPPAAVVARTTAKIALLRISDKSMVEKGELLAVLQNPADYNQILSLYSCIDSFFARQVSGITNITACDNYFSLGEIQSEYAQFTKALKDYRNFLALDYHVHKILLLQKEAKKYEEYMQQLNRQKLIMQREVELAGKQFVRDSEMYRKGVIPEADFEKAQSVYLQKKYNFENAGVELSKTKIQLSESEQAILEFLKVPYLVAKRGKIDWISTSYYMAGQSYEKMSKYDQAITMYKQIIDRKDTDAQFKTAAQKEVDRVKIIIGKQ